MCFWPAGGLGVPAGSERCEGTAETGPVNIASEKASESFLQLLGLRCVVSCEWTVEAKVAGVLL